MNKLTPQSYVSDLPMEISVVKGAPPEVVAAEGVATVAEGEVIEISEGDGGGGGVGAVAEVTDAEAAAMELTVPQRMAIVRLTGGSSYVEAATAAGVSRMTLYRWLNHDPAFQAAFNAWQRDVLSTARGQLTAMTRDALGAVVGAIRGGDARLAWKLLESQGVTEKPEAGPTDVAELRRREELERKKREIAEKRERNRVAKEEFEAEMEVF